MIVPKPPAETAIIGPHIGPTKRAARSAVTPDSKAPSSFDVEINTEFTAETRPRMASGVSTCTKVWRTTTEMLSNTPVKISAASESQKLRERPNTIVAAPKPATHQSRLRPAFFIGG